MSESSIGLQCRSEMSKANDKIECLRHITRSFVGVTYRSRMSDSIVKVALS